MVGVCNLVPFEEAEIDAAEASVLNRPHGGTLDRLIAKAIERLGFGREEIAKIMGHDPYVDAESSKEPVFLNAEA